MKRTAYYYDKKHFGNSISIYDNENWYFIIIKDRDHYGFSALTKDRTRYYNIDSQVREMKYVFDNVDNLKEIQKSISIDFSEIFFSDCPDFISRLLDTGNLYESRKFRGIFQKILKVFRKRNKTILPDFKSCVESIDRGGITLYEKDEALRLVEILDTNEIDILGVDTFLLLENNKIQPNMKYSPDYTTADLKISCFEAARRDILRFSDINNDFVYEIIYEDYPKVRR